MKRNIKRLSLAAAALGLAIGGTGLTLISYAHASTGAQNTQQEKSTASLNISQSDAINKFNERYGSKSLKEIELKHKNNKYIYEIEGFDSAKEYEVKIDATTGKILKAKSEKFDENGKEDALDLNELINRDDATQIAQSKVPGQAVKWSLEMDDKQPVWEVELKDGKKEAQIKIDAKTQKILKTEVDDDHDEKYDKDDKKHDDKKEKKEKEHNKHTNSKNTNN